MSTGKNQPQLETLMGHPTGLFTLFFAEMWERFSYYGMRALLVLYMTKGFLGYGDSDAYAVYGAYGALVYATPYIGGMLADRLLGARRAVVLGGLLMAAGHLTMTIENETIFFLALALLICGNGFFKPNISTIVGTLYPKASAKKEAGFTIFYMGINLGAALAPIICGYVGETYGWHYGFGLATVGMLTGIAVFVAPTRLTQMLIMGGAVSTAIGMLWLDGTTPEIIVRMALSAALVVSGLLAVLALGRGGLPREAGAAPSEDRLRKPAFPALRQSAVTYYLAIIASVLVLQQVTTPSSLEAWMLGGIAGAAILLPWLSARNAVYVCVAGAVPAIILFVQRSEIAGYMLVVLGVLAFGSLFREALSANKIERERMYVVLVLTFFSMLFWAFFEQAGSSVNLFTDRNVDRVLKKGDRITEKEVEKGVTIKFRVPFITSDSELAKLPLLSQEQLGYKCNDEIFERVKRAVAREEAKKPKNEEDSKNNDAAIARLTRAIQKMIDKDKEKNGDEASVSISISTSRVDEDGDSNLTYTITRGGKTEDALIVNFEVSGTAEFKKDDKKTDYTQTGALSFRKDSGSVEIPVGKESATVTIDPKLDETMEGDETVVLTVTAGANYELGDTSEATGKITNDDKFFTITHLDVLRAEAKKKDATGEDKVVEWIVPKGDKHSIGMVVGGEEIPTSVFQAVNPIYIVVFGLAFSALWTFLRSMRLEPSTTVKFALGLLQLGLGFGAFWYGTTQADPRGMVALQWLLVGYFFHTTGELCLSPVGLSMITKLSPARIVSTVMGAWFLATGFSNYLASLIAMFTGVSHGGGEQKVIPIPKDTLDTYGSVFGTIALSAIGSALVCFALAPLLTRWMHSEAGSGDDTTPYEES